MKRKKHLIQKIIFGIIRISALLVVIALFSIILFIAAKGWKAINWEFLTQAPRDAMTKGGIFPAILGTFCLTIGAIIIALPLGVATAIYLTEYSNEGKIVKIIRHGINNLAGVPSIIFGLFGLAFFVTFLNFKASILSGSLTLGFLILPIIIGSTEEALKTVPQSFREASLALGSTKWQTIKKIVLPAALPGILTGAIIGIGRAAGETAPIMFTAATFYTTRLPKSIFDEVMALPNHIYVMATAGTHIEETRHIQYGTALVLITLVLILNAGAIIARYKFRKKLKGE